MKEERIWTVTNDGWYNPGDQFVTYLFQREKAIPIKLTRQPSFPDGAWGVTCESFCIHRNFGKPDEFTAEEAKIIALRKVCESLDLYIDKLMP